MGPGLTGNREIGTITNPEDDDTSFPPLDEDEVALWHARGGSSNFGQSFIQGGKLRNSKNEKYSTIGSWE